MAHACTNANIWIGRPPSDHKNTSRTAVHCVGKLPYPRPVAALEDANRSLNWKRFVPKIFVFLGPVTAQHAGESGNRFTRLNNVYALFVWPRCSCSALLVFWQRKLNSVF